MNTVPNVETIGNIGGIVIAALIAGWVRYDAKKRGLKTSAAVGWGVGVFLLLIVFLPLYLWMRSKNFPVSPLAMAPQNPAPIAGVPCPYCGYENAGNSDYCGKCGRQMRSSTEIHR